MSAFGRALVLSLLSLLVARPAQAQPLPPQAIAPRTGPPAPPTFVGAPPPDPTKGERYDGRTDIGPHAWNGYDKALLVPRLILWIPRELYRHVLWPIIGPGVKLTERYHVIQWAEYALTSADGRVGVRPVFNFVSGYRATFGLAFFDERLLGEGTDFRISASGNFGRTFLTDLRLRPTHFGRAVEYTFYAGYIKRDDYLYSGIGERQARTNPLARYSVDEVDAHNFIDLVATPFVSLHLDGMFGLRRFGNGTNLGGDVPIDEVYCTRVLEGRCLAFEVDPRKVPGWNGTQFLRGHVLLRVDSRDAPQRPTSGAVLEVGADYSHGLGFDDSSYLRAQGSLVGVIDLYRRSRVLVLRATAEEVFPFGTTPVPFSELPVLGTPDLFRGARWGKYRDHTLFLLTAEYRWPIWMWMDAALFADYGGVFGKNWVGFSFNDMIPGFGLALRIRTSRQFYLRVQGAYGVGEGWNFSISASTDPL